jgi:serine phosphatase RsbU (regulator of sigma subunit)/CRP-like cAMP-binding protein
MDHHSTSELDHLRYNVLCEPLTESEFNELRSMLVRREFMAGEEILREEHDTSELFLIASGRVNIVRHNGDGTDLRLAVLHAGDFFGELEVIDSRPRSARVVALDSVVTYTLTKPVFDKLLSANLAFTRRLLEVVSVRLRAMNNHVVRELSLCKAYARKEVHNLEQLVDASRNLNSTLNLEEVLDRILATALQIVDGDRGTVYMLDERKHELWSRVLTGDGRLEIRLPIGKGIAGYVAATGDTINSADAYMDPRFNPEVDRESGYRTRSMLCMPMRNHKGKIIGVFQLLNKHTGTFSIEDEGLIDALSVHAAVAVENARLYEQERQKLGLEKKILAAREVQMTLLPKEIPVIPGLELAASMKPAEEVGWDLYDFLTLHDGTIAACLGDVSGKGLPASLLMANTQAVIRAFAPVSFSPSDCLRRANRSLYQSIPPEKFVTALYAVIDPDGGQISYANAGQEPPLLISPDGSVRALRSGGIMLGMMEDFVYEDESVEFPREGVLLIVSDGVTEATDADGNMFGSERMEEIVVASRHLTAEGIRTALLDAIHEFVGETKQSDDITIVLVKRK